MAELAKAVSNESLPIQARAAALAAISVSDYEGKHEVIAVSLLNSNDEFAAAGVRSIGRTQSPEILQVVREIAIGKRAESVRSQAIWVLGNSGDLETLQRISNSQDESIELRVTAIRMQSRSWSSVAENKLSELLADPNPEVRANAGLTLAKHLREFSPEFLLNVAAQEELSAETMQKILVQILKRDGVMTQNATPEQLELLSGGLLTRDRVEFLWRETREEIRESRQESRNQ